MSVPLVSIGLRCSKPLKENRFVIPKSRYDSVDLYISEDPLNRSEYNDTHVPYDITIYNRLKDHGEKSTFNVLHILDSNQIP